MDLYTNGGNIRLENYRRFTSLTMYNLHIFYLAPLMFLRSSNFLISGLHTVNTKIKGQPHWVVLLDLCQLFHFMHDYCFLLCMWHQVIDLFPSKQAGILWRTSTYLPSRAAWFRCMIIVSFHVCDLTWSICFLQSRRVLQAWADRRTKINVAQKSVHVLFFLVVGEEYQFE